MKHKYSKHMALALALALALISSISITACSDDPKTANATVSMQNAN